MKFHAVASVVFASVSLATTACSSKSNDVPVVVQPHTESAPEVKVEDAPQALLQQSVARLVTQLEIENKQVLVYQDSYSSFYDRLSKSESAAGRIPASLIYFYTPHFVVGNIKVSVLDSELIELKIENKTSLSALLGMVKSSLKEKIGVDADNSQIVQLPISIINSSVHISGKTYKVTVASDFSHAVVTISKNDIPEALRNDRSGVEVKKLMSLFSIKYNYWALPFNEDQCALGIDMKSIKSDFTGTSGGNGSSNSPAAAPNSGSASDSSQLLSAAQRPVTLDLTRKAVSSMKKSMDARCTSSAGGMGWDSISKVLSKMFEKGTDYVLSPNDKGDWDATMRNIVSQYMDPAKFTSTINSINESLTKKESLAEALSKSEDSKKVAKAISEVDSHHSSEQASASNRTTNAEGEAGGSMFGLFEASGSGSYASTSQSNDMSRSGSSDYSRHQNETDDQYSNRMNSQLEKAGYSAHLTNINGEIKLVPQVRITLVNELNFDESILATLKATQLGVLRSQVGEVNADVSVSEKLQLTIQAQCDQNVSKQTVDMKSPAWLLTPDVVVGNAVGTLASNLNLSGADGCSEFRIALGVLGNKGELTEDLGFNIQAQGSVAGVVKNYSQYLFVNANRPEDSQTFGVFNGPRAQWTVKVTSATPNP